MKSRILMSRDNEKWAKFKTLVCMCVCMCVHVYVCMCVCVVVSNDIIHVCDHSGLAFY